MISKTKVLLYFDDIRIQKQLVGSIGTYGYVSRVSLLLRLKHFVLFFSPLILDKEELETRCGDLEDELMKVNEKKNQEEASDAQVEIEKMKKALQTEKILKQQAVNKLAQVMNAKENLPKTGKAASKAVSTELKKKEKENRKLQLDLNNEKEKFNQMVAKYQKDLQDLQVRGFF